MHCAGANDQLCANEASGGGFMLAKLARNRGAAPILIISYDTMCGSKKAVLKCAGASLWREA